MDVHPIYPFHLFPEGRVWYLQLEEEQAEKYGYARER